MCSAWLIASHSRQELSGIDGNMKTAFYKHVKLTWQQFAKHAGEATVHLPVLPQDPFDESFMPLWAVAFPNGGPVANKLDDKLVQMVDQSYGCRGGGGALFSTVAQPPASSTSLANPSSISSLSYFGGGGAGGGMERIASQFMERMGEMQSSQQRFMELILQTQRGGNTLQALSMGSHLSKRPTLALSAGPIATVCTPSIEEVNLNDSVAHLALTDLPPVPPTTVAAQATPAPNPVEEMLNAFDARRKSTAKAKATAKAMAKAEIPEAGLPLNSKAKAKAVPETKASAKAAPEAKANAKAPPEAMAKAEIPRASKKAKKKSKKKNKKYKKAKAKEVPETKASAKANAKAAPGAKADANAVQAKASTKADPETPKAKPKTKAKAVAKEPPSVGKASPPKHKAKAAANLIYGCTKCRYKAHGCAQCWNPDFNGTRWNPFS